MSAEGPLSPASEAARKKHFRDMAHRDALEEASPEERELLRKDENLGLWREALVSLLADLQREFRDRKKTHNRVKDRANKDKTDKARAALQRESEEYESWKLNASAYKVDLDEKLSENKAARQQRHYRWNESRDPKELLRRSRDLLSGRRDAGDITDDEDELLKDIRRLLDTE